MWNKLRCEDLHAGTKLAGDRVSPARQSACVTAADGSRKPLWLPLMRPASKIPLRGNATTARTSELKLPTAAEEIKAWRDAKNLSVL